MEKNDNAPDDTPSPLKVGEQLRKEREFQGLTLEDIVKPTRIAVRHLQAIEESDFSVLPGRPYVIGFIKAYAGALGLSEEVIAQAISEELKDSDYITRPAYEAYKPTDPVRLPTHKVVWGFAIVALLLSLAYGVWRYMAIYPKEAFFATYGSAAHENNAETPRSPSLVADALVKEETVVLIATGMVWIGFEDADGTTEAYRTLQTGESYTVPPDYIERLTLRTANLQLLKIMVGEQEITLGGSADKLIRHISLKPSELLTRSQGKQAQDN